MRGGGVGGLGRRGGCSRASKRGERVWRAGRGRWRSSRSREGGGAGRSPRGVAVNVERVGAGGWPRWPLAQRGRRCEGLCGRGKCGHARRVLVLGGRGGTPTATPPSRRTAGRRRAWRRRGHLGCGRRVHQHLRPTLARCFLLLTFFFFSRVSAASGRLAAPHALCMSGWDTNRGGGRPVVCAQGQGWERRATAKADEEARRLLRARQDTGRDKTHTTTRPPPPPCTPPSQEQCIVRPRQRQTARTATTKPLRRTRGEAAACQPSAEGGQSRPASTARTAGRPAQE